MKVLGEAIGTSSMQERHPASPHHKLCYKIVVNSDIMFDHCYGLVGSTDKSHSPLSVPKMSRDLIRHFVRGYMDGDGSLFFKTYKTRHGKEVTQFGMSFTAGNETGDLLEGLRELLVSEVGVSRRAIVGKESRKLPFAQYDANLICSWLYTGASIYMRRKRGVWDKVDDEKVQDGRKFHSRDGEIRTPVLSPPKRAPDR